MHVNVFCGTCIAYTHMSLCCVLCVYVAIVSFLLPYPPTYPNSFIVAHEHECWVQSFEVQQCISLLCDLASLVYGIMLRRSCPHRIVIHVANALFYTLSPLLVSAPLVLHMLKVFYHLVSSLNSVHLKLMMVFSLLSGGLC